MRWSYSHNFFCEVIKGLVPERASEIEDIVKKNNINFQAIKDLPEIKFQVNDKGIIEISAQPLRRFWAHIYAYYSFYNYIEHNGWKCQINFGNNKQTAKAAEVLKWAVNSDLNPRDTNIKYPNGAPIPFDINSNDPILICAKDITVYGLANILLHEIAHLELKHAFNCSDKCIAIQQENEADKWASHFVMDKMDDYIKRNYPSNSSKSETIYKKRSLALVASMHWLIKNECYYGVPHHTGHPSTFERLNAIVDELASDENDLLWAMTAFVLSLHLQQFHPDMISNQEYLTYKECAQHYMNCISSM